MNTKTRVVLKKVEIAQGVYVDGYLLPDGEIRIGKQSASAAAGFNEKYLAKIEQSPKQFEALKAFGFSNYTKLLEVSSARVTRAETISLDDFHKLIIYGTTKNRKESIAIMVATSLIGLTNYFRSHFDQKALSKESAKDLMFKEYARVLDWRIEDKLDWALIKEQEDFLGQ